MIEDTPARYKARMQKHAGMVLGAAADAAKAAGVACETVQMEHEHPYQAIIDTAASKTCNLIVMASHGRHGFSALVLGSETVKVLTHCKVPVLVHRYRDGAAAVRVTELPLPDTSVSGRKLPKLQTGQRRDARASGSDVACRRPRLLLFS